MTETTVSQFLEFLRATGNRHFWNEAEKQFAMHKHCPASRNLGWYDVARFCNWLTDQENERREASGSGANPLRYCYEPLDIGNYGHGVNLVEGADGFRMPTLLEWEYACRAGSHARWSFGDNPDLLPQYARYYDNSSELTWPVGSCMPNAYGLFDMHGNVLEFCHDVYRVEISQNGESVSVPPCLTNERFEVNASSRFAASGGDLYKRSLLTVTRRIELKQPTSKRPGNFGYIGVRIARSAPERTTDDLTADR